MNSLQLTGDSLIGQCGPRVLLRVRKGYRHACAVVEIPRLREADFRARDQQMKNGVVSPLPRRAQVCLAARMILSYMMHVSNMSTSKTYTDQSETLYAYV